MPGNPILFFDGDCTLCNRAVLFVLRFESSPVIHFCSLQDEAYKLLMAQYGIEIPEADSIVFLENGKAYLKAQAVFLIAKYLRWPFKLLYYFKWLPDVVTNAVYDVVAKWRYRWFGKTTHCVLATPELQHRLVAYEKHNVPAK